jgi:putative flippase GtrA
MTILRFAVVGVLLNAVNFAVYLLFLEFSHYLTALFVSHLLSLLYSPAVYRKLVFYSRESYMVSAKRYFSTSLIPLSVNTVLLPLLVESGLIDASLAQLLIMILLGLVMFLLGKFYSFK